jgi:hypothetical protein
MVAVAVAVAMLVGLSVAGAGTALADEASVNGTGALTAEGTGYAGIRGSGTVQLEAGAGTVWITGADTIEVEGQGRRTTLPDGTVRLTGASGAVQIQGTDMGVRIASGRILFTAEGTGSVYLRGYGTYSTANGTSGNWSPDGMQINF